MQANDTRLSRANVLKKLSKIPGFFLPLTELMTTMREIDLGDRVLEGIGFMPPKIRPGVYPDFVSAIDEDGNETAGIRMPDVTVPVGTHTGFNSRLPKTGGVGQLLDYLGSTVPFAKTVVDRERSGDLRLSIAERYKSREEYLGKINKAAKQLVDNRYLLERDIDLCIKIAGERYDLCTIKS